jgi:hypothetical protein
MRSRRRSSKHCERESLAPARPRDHVAAARAAGDDGRGCVQLGHPEYPKPAPCLACPWTSMKVSLTSSSAYPRYPAGSGDAPSSTVSPAIAIRNREATASSWRTWPKVKVLRNEPNVEVA